MHTETTTTTNGTTTTVTTVISNEPTSAFVEQFGGTCQNLCETSETGEAALAVAQNYTRGGKIIQIPGKFIWVEGKVVGIEKPTGEKLFKNEEGFYHCEDLEAFAKA